MARLPVPDDDRAALEALSDRIGLLSEQITTAQHARDAIVVRLMADRVPAPRIAEAAGITKARVQQIANRDAAA